MESKIIVKIERPNFVTFKVPLKVLAFPDNLISSIIIYTSENTPPKKSVQTLQMFHPNVVFL